MDQTEMILASVFITSEPKEEAELPVKVRENIDSFRRCCGGVEHRLFTDALCREFIRKEYGKDVLAAYDALKPYTYKANLARYCIIHHFGGTYSDVSCYFFRKWMPTGTDDAKQIAVFSAPFGAPWAVPPTIFYAPKGHKTLVKSIELVCESVKSRYYGSNPLCPTGTVLFGRALALTCEPAEISYGRAQWVNPTGDLAKVISETSVGFAYENALIAVKRKRGGGSQAELGILGGNDYVASWNARDIYAGV